MRQFHLCLIAVVASVSSSAALAASAEPATGAAPFSAIDPNTFILGHPASPRWKAAHSGGEHPAVLVARRALQPASIDTNRFIVQPPASVRWLASGEAVQAQPTAVATLAP
ncbi:hypothetical protein C7444_10253 [Sphaerotilus hippei]|uniref:Uncharacterized protein n=1 Tax=Sphaerotilus hippei TaxID=744406 RepID=A0A318H4E8_9BURK|nr:hypothetical protein [Sphaerotilus hippei]PXW98576.1 hypothetical protein C7444_10253 [Sphaerotilus hippei]